MARYRIRNVNTDRYGRTTEVGEAGVWKATKDEVVGFIRSGTHTFYVQEVNPAVEVRVIPTNPPYLKTEADSTSKNNLDNLPAF